jgi:hypothetical protein
MKTALPSTIAAGAWLACLSLGLGGCAATQVALEHKDLAVQTQMSHTVFLDLENRTEKTVFLDVRNTSDRDLTIEPMIRGRLEQAGYRLLSDPQAAFYILQVNVLQVGQTSPSALSASMKGGWGGPVAGAVSGAAIASSTNTAHGNLKGAAIGAAVEMIFGSLVKDVTYSITTDIQITERTNVPVTQKVETKLHQGPGTEIAQTGESVVNRRKYQTRLVSSANRVNLKFEQALPALADQMARSIAGIL